MAGTEDKIEYCVCYLLENGAWRTTDTKGAEAVLSTAGASAIFIKKQLEKQLDSVLDSKPILMSNSQNNSV